MNLQQQAFRGTDRRNNPLWEFSRIQNSRRGGKKGGEQNIGTGFLKNFVRDDTDMLGDRDRRRGVAKEEMATWTIRLSGEVHDQGKRVFRNSFEDRKKREGDSELFAIRLERSSVFGPQLGHCAKD